MGHEQWTTPVLRLRKEMREQPTGVVADLKPLSAIKAVIFDVYGTLVISGSGDVGTADRVDHSECILQSLEAVGVLTSLSVVPTTAMIQDEIERMNRVRVRDNCPKPEVDIVEVWRRVLTSCGLERSAQATGQIVELAAQYEARANPTWPMSGSESLLASLHRAALPMGIVSNAQIFTPSLVEDLLAEKKLEAGGFAIDLCLFSNRYRQSKPGPRLFDALRDALSRRGILPYEAIYVGNDMLNDVWAASQAGLRTAWFAGEARSLRRREDDARCRSLRPDIVLTSLMQLLKCLTIKQL